MEEKSDLGDLADWSVRADRLNDVLEQQQSVVFELFSLLRFLLLNADRILEDRVFSFLDLH